QQDRTCGRIKFCSANVFFDGEELFPRSPRCQNIRRVPGEPFENLRHLMRSFSGAEDDLGHSHAEMTVVIYFCESQVFKRKVTKLLDGIIGREFASASLSE